MSIMTDKEFRDAITAYAHSGGPFASRELMESWIEVNVNDADCEIHKIVRSFHAHYGRYPTPEEVPFQALRAHYGRNLSGETAT